jgi:molecular chaperone GrpE (heat shock protein)
MKHLKEIFGSQLSERAIEELTLVKTALQEKNEALDARDERIREMTRRIRDLERRINEMEESCTECRERAAVADNVGGNDGVDSLLADIIHLLSRYECEGCGEEGYGSIPGETLLNLLREKYDVEVLDSPVESIDPHIHRVVEVKRENRREQKIVRLSRGYRVKGRVIRPVTLQVITGGCEGGDEDRDEPQLVLLGDPAGDGIDPGGVA